MLCWGGFYALMDAIARSGKPIPGGFIHVPAKGMPIETIAKGLAIAVRGISGEETPKQIPKRETR